MFEFRRLFVWGNRLSQNPITIIQAQGFRINTEISPTALKFRYYQSINLLNS